ncbi:MAG: RNA polymerase factor sigma-54 [Fimbriimonadaceae bacterium]|nr:RNA polymerase factor sigma-54 [Fimbriimonadaceae bacterium]
MAFRPGNWNSQNQELRQGLRVDPQLVLRSHILQLSQADLEQAVEAELADNPALERLEDDTEPITEEGVLKSVAPQELKPSSDDYEFQRSTIRDDEDVMDWLDFAACETRLSDHLKAQLFPIVEPEHHKLAEFVIGCLDEKGYLIMPLDEVAASTNMTVEDVEAVLHKLQQCDPAGIGARNVQECLLLQLQDPDTVEQKLAREIAKHYLDEMIARRTGKIARKFKAPTEMVEAAFQEILALNPYPAQGFAANSHSARQKPIAVRPDIILTRSEIGWVVEVEGVDASSLVVDRSYRQRLAKLEAKAQADKDEKKHLGEYVGRADNFIQSIKERKKTLRRIGEYLIEKQTSFISTGRYQYLQPLTKSIMARELGLHESTVSRATMGKFVQIEDGEIVPFEVFFKPALRIQKMIEEILETENPSTPLSDEAIARLLADRGVVVARRTVNKYRDRTRLLSSRGRRTA